MRKKLHLCTLILASSVLFFGCARSKIKSPDQALRISKTAIEYHDDLGSQDLLKAITSILEFYKDKPESVLAFGPFKVSRKNYILALEDVQGYISSGATESEVLLYIDKKFMALEVFGNKKWGEAFMTSYYEPIIKACTRPLKECSDPVFRIPNDFVNIDMGAYFKTFEGLSEAKQAFLNKSRSLGVAGRIVDDELKNKKIIPYHDRRAHYEGQVAVKLNKPIAFVDPVDHFFLQIQGSGTLDFGKKQLRVGYAGQNGHPYVAIGKYLTDAIPIEEMSMQKIEAHLRTLEKKELIDLLSKNPSYVYFTDIAGAPVTYSGSEVIAGRTIATDPKYFPKGVMGFLRFNKPVFEGDKITAWSPASRFVFDQDTGGAIRGAGRLDLFWGKGPEAEKYAGVMRHDVQLYYLVPRSELPSK